MGTLSQLIFYHISLKILYFSNKPLYKYAKINVWFVNLIEARYRNFSLINVLNVSKITNYLMIFVLKI